MTLFGIAAIIAATGVLAFLGNFHRRQPNTTNVTHLHVHGTNADAIARQLAEIIQTARQKQ